MARIWGRAKSQSPAGTPGTPRCHRCHRCHPRHPRHPRHAAQRESHVCHVCHVAVWWALLSDNNWQQLTTTTPSSAPTCRFSRFSQFSRFSGFSRDSFDPFWRAKAILPPELLGHFLLWGGLAVGDELNQMCHKMYPYVSDWLFSGWRSSIAFQGVKRILGTLKKVCQTFWNGT